MVSQFPLDKPIPYPLMTKIVEFRVKENLKNAAVRTKKSSSCDTEYTVEASFVTTRRGVPHDNR